MDFTLDKYRELLTALKLHRDFKLRHDVDLRPDFSLRIAHIEAEMGSTKTSYAASQPSATTPATTTNASPPATATWKRPTRTSSTIWINYEK